MLKALCILSSAADGSQGNKQNKSTKKIIRKVKCSHSHSYTTRSDPGDYFSALPRAGITADTVFACFCLQTVSCLLGNNFQSDFTPIWYLAYVMAASVFLGVPVVSISVINEVRADKHCLIISEYFPGRFCKCHSWAPGHSRQV